MEASKIIWPLCACVLVVHYDYQCRVPIHIYAMHKVSSEREKDMWCLYFIATAKKLHKYNEKVMYENIRYSCFSAAHKQYIIYHDIKPYIVM